MSVVWDFFNNKEKDSFGPNQLTNGSAEPGSTAGWTALNLSTIIGGVDIYGDYVFKIGPSGYMSQEVTPPFNPPEIEVYGFFYISDYLKDPHELVELIVQVDYTDSTFDIYTFPIVAAINTDYPGNIFIPAEYEVYWYLIRETITINKNKTVDVISYAVLNRSDLDLYADNLALRLNNNIPVSRSGYNNGQIVDKYGINPLYLDYFKNMVYNSSFEWYEDATPTPTYWTGGGLSDPNSSFFGSRSCMLAAGDYIETDSDAYINPTFYDNEITRVSFNRKLGQIKVEVYDNTNAAYFTLTDIDDNTGSSITFAANTNWQDSKVSVSFDPTEHGVCTSLKIVITNVHPTETSYVDAVMLQPDYTGKWPQIYKDGPNSFEREIVKSTVAPTDKSKFWLDIS